MPFVTLWWILYGIVAVAILMLLWAAGSVLYLKLRFRGLSEAEKLRFGELNKEESGPSPETR